MTATAASETAPPRSLRDQVRSAVIWRSGTQIFSQLVAWASTFLGSGPIKLLAREAIG
ncbi:hypothetical protein [Novosphingobium arvoryzae]|uniref:hypothetical protein n=1 Tax=Novosphingobium arvoryzae TaxID=1256514 RepID=UPI001673F0F0|nr:hypothetical protein [Novosphingobium arvoryzae]